MIATLFAFLVAGKTYRAPTVRPPTVGAQCEGSRSVYALGTGNIPGSSGQATTVVNIWTILPPKGPPLAWIYKNLAGGYFVQLNNVHYAGAIREAFPHMLTARLLHGSSDSFLPRPSPISSPDAYDRYFSKLGGRRYSCYTHDLPSKYL